MDTLTGIGNRALLLQASRGAARLIAARVTASPRVAFGAALAALVAGIGGNALLFQAGREAPPPAPAAQNAKGTVEPVAAHASPPATAAPAAPATTASLGPAPGDRPQAAAPAAGGPKATRRHAAAPRQPDLIGAFLDGMTVDDSHPAHDARGGVRRPHRDSSRREKGE